MATAMNIPLTFRGRQWNCKIGDTLMALAPFANHALTTMMLQMDCGGIDLLRSVYRWYA